MGKHTYYTAADLTNNPPLTSVTVLIVVGVHHKHVIHILINDSIIITNSYSMFADNKWLAPSASVCRQTVRMSA